MSCKKLHLFLAVAFILVLFVTCNKKKDDTTNSGSSTEIVFDSIVSISPFKANVYGQIKKLSSQAHPEFGLCYSTTNQIPTVDDEKRIFTGPVYQHAVKDSAINLIQGKTYYMRIYVVDGNAAVYSNVKPIAMPSAAPIVSGATDVTRTSATLNGMVNGYGIGGTAVFQYGPTIAYGQSINANPNVITGTSEIHVTAGIGNLTAGTNYHYRLVMNYNSIGTIPGYDTNFIATAIPVPVSTTLDVSNLFYNRATLRGEVTANQSLTTVWFEVGTSSTYGNTVPANPHTVNGSTPVAVSDDLLSLNPNTTYYYRLKATNEGGTSYGSNMTFTTPVIPAPTPVTGGAQPLSHSAVIHGTINTHGAPSMVYFEYGTTTAYGQEIFVGNNIVTYSDSAVSAALTSLSPSTNYHYCLKATSAGGTATGSDQNFSTSQLLHIGDNWAGGIIFYIDASQDHGYVCATSNQSDAAWWGCDFENLGTGTAIGTGAANTQMIGTQCEADAAGTICWNLILNGHNDWFLPSKDELNQMYVNLKKNLNLGSFSSGLYWSSSENGEHYAWYQSFINGTQDSYWDRTFSLNVRAARAF
jgi:hypothetical protein